MDRRELRPEPAFRLEAIRVRYLMRAHGLSQARPPLVADLLFEKDRK
jgi:hypothetical protein